MQESILEHTQKREGEGMTRRISRDVLEHMQDPIAKLVWEHWIATGEATLEETHE